MDRILVHLANRVHNGTLGQMDVIKKRLAKPLRTPEKVSLV